MYYSTVICIFVPAATHAVNLDLTIHMADWLVSEYYIPLNALSIINCELKSNGQTFTEVWTLENTNL